jgi:hypothetical protein
VNYEQARQIGPDGPAPGKWNWTNLNDSVQPAPYTIAPCAWPDFKWPPFDPSRSLDEQSKVTPTGRERCDHDTQEEAERHHWQYELSHVSPHPIDKATVRQLDRCDHPGCNEWADYTMRWPDSYRQETVCTKHLTVESLVERHPFTPGLQAIHS